MTPSHKILDPPLTGDTKYYFRALILLGPEIYTADMIIKRHGKFYD